MAECDTANRKLRTLFSARCAWSAVPAWLLCGSGISTPRMGSQKEFGISRQRSINLSFCFVVCAANAPMLLLFHFGKLLLHTRFARGMRRFGGDLSNHEITTTQGCLSICLNFTEYLFDRGPANCPWATVEPWYPSWFRSVQAAGFESQLLPSLRTPMPSVANT